jgi:3-methyladenine DNA glycosylase Tag
VINERVVVGYGKTMPAKTPLSETISSAVRKRGFQFGGPVIVCAWMQAVGIVNDHETHCFRRNAAWLSGQKPPRHEDNDFRGER